jgi:hypothetical protein
LKFFPVPPTLVAGGALKQEKVNFDLVDDLRVLPSEIESILLDLELLYKLPITDDDRDEVSSVSDIINLICQRRIDPSIES